MATREGWARAKEWADALPAIVERANGNIQAYHPESWVTLPAALCATTALHYGFWWPRRPSGCNLAKWAAVSGALDDLEDQHLFTRIGSGTGRYVGMDLTDHGVEVLAFGLKTGKGRLGLHRAPDPAGGDWRPVVVRLSDVEPEPWPSPIGRPQPTAETEQFGQQLQATLRADSRPRHRARVSRNVRPALRFRVLERDGFRCRYCGRSSDEVALHVDHVLPVSAGGLNSEANLVAACRDCNLGKGARLLTAFAPEAA